MDIDAVHDFLLKHLVYDPGRFYFPGSGLSLGAGQIYRAVRYPAYNEEYARFNTLEGLVYILTHECDIDQQNNRAFNADVLICPIIQLDHVIYMLLDSKFGQRGVGGDEIKNVVFPFVEKLAKRQMHRLVYLPCYPPDLPYGGVLYLNFITNTNVKQFEAGRVERVGSVTMYGLRVVDQAVENHLLRPKEEELALQRY